MDDSQKTLFDIGNPHLSPREREVALGAANGLTRDQIAHTLKVSTKTVKTYCENIRKKTGCQTLVSAIYKLAKDKII